jgi:hypothetical protein
MAFGCHCVNATILKNPYSIIIMKRSRRAFVAAPLSPSY